MAKRTLASPGSTSAISCSCMFARRPTVAPSSSRSTGSLTRGPFVAAHAVASDESSSSALAPTDRARDVIVGRARWLLNEANMKEGFDPAAEPLRNNRAQIREQAERL